MSSFPGVAYGTVTVIDGVAFLTPQEPQAVVICGKGGTIAGRLAGEWFQAQAPRGWTPAMGAIKASTRPQRPMYLLRGICFAIF